MIQRRRLLAGAGFAAATALAAPSVLRAEPRTVKMGALRLVHSMPPYFYEKLRAGRPQDRDHRVRQPDRRQECRGHQVGRLRHLRHRRRHSGRRRGRARRRRGRALQQGHGRHLQGRLRHQDRQGPQGQARRHLAGLDAGGLHHGAPAHGGPVDQGRHGRARAVRRDAGHAGARRRRRLCRRRARPRLCRSPRARASSSNIPTRRRWAA